MFEAAFVVEKLVYSFNHERKIISIISVLYQFQFNLVVKAPNLAQTTVYPWWSWIRSPNF